MCSEQAEGMICGRKLRGLLASPPRQGLAQPCSTHSVAAESEGIGSRRKKEKKKLSKRGHRNRWNKWDEGQSVFEHQPRFCQPDRRSFLKCPALPNTDQMAKTPGHPQSASRAPVQLRALLLAACWLTPAFTPSQVGS